MARILLTSAGLVAVPFLSVVLDLALHSTAAETDVLGTIVFYLAYFGVILSPLLIGGLAVLAVAAAAASAVLRSGPSESTVAAAASLTAFWWVRMAAWTLGVSLAGWWFHRILHAALDSGPTPIEADASRTG